MLIAIFSILVLASVINTVVTLKVSAKSDERYQETSGYIAQFFNPKGKDQPSPFGEVVDSVSEVFADKLGTRIQAGIRGQLGGNVKGLNRGLEEVAMQEDPSLAVLDSLPKSLKKNPVAMMGLQSIVSRIMASQSNGSPGQSGNGTGSGGGQAKFSL